MSDSRDELRARFDSTRSEQSANSEDNPEDAPNQEEVDKRGNTDDAGNSDDSYDWGNKYNYPLYMPREFADKLDKLYNQYDGKNKVAGGDGLEKHREFLFPIMEAAVEELDLEKVIDWETDEE